MKKYTQHDLVVLALAEKRDWCFSYIFKGVFTPHGLIGSEADTRLYELFDKCVTDAPLKTAERKIDGNTYTIETKKDGNRRVYRAWLSKEKPAPPKINIVEMPNGQRVALVS